jgi:hypothetical protein
MNAKSIMAISWRRLLVVPLLALVLGLAQVGSAQAAVVINEWFPAVAITPGSGDLTNPCTGTTEFGGVEGEAHVQVRTTVSRSGQAHVGVSLNFNAQGDVLSVNTVQNVVQNIDLSDGAPVNGTDVTWGLINERGVADNAYQKILFHMTINANGDVTSMKLEFGETECRG